MGAVVVDAPGRLIVGLQGRLVLSHLLQAFALCQQGRCGASFVRLGLLKVADGFREIPRPLQPYANFVPQGQISRVALGPRLVDVEFQAIVLMPQSLQLLLDLLAGVPLRLVFGLGHVRP